MNQNNKPLGILQAGALSTDYYTQKLRNYYKPIAETSIPWILEETDFEAINKLLPYPSRQLDSLIYEHLKALKIKGVEAILIPNITLHETVDRLDIQTPIVHPVHLTIAELKKHNADKICLFGSLYTMQSEYIRDPFQTNNIETTLPSSEDMQTIDDYRKIVYNGTENLKSRQEYQNILAKYLLQHPVVIACTELSMASDNGNPLVFDMAEIQIATCVDIISRIRE